MKWFSSLVTLSQIKRGNVHEEISKSNQPFWGYDKRAIIEAHSLKFSNFKVLWDGQQAILSVVTIIRGQNFMKGDAGQPRIKWSILPLMQSFVLVSKTSDRILHAAKPTTTHRLQGGIFAALCITPKYIVTAKQGQEKIQLIMMKQNSINKTALQQTSGQQCKLIRELNVQ